MNTMRLKTVEGFGAPGLGAVRILNDEGVQIAGCHVPNNGRNNEQDAAELVKRWNTHTALSNALDEMNRSARALVRLIENSGLENGMENEIGDIYTASLKASAALNGEAITEAK